MVLGAARTESSGGDTPLLLARLIEQRSGADLKRLRQLLDHSHRGVAPAALDVADIGSVDAGAVGVILLAPALRLSQAANI